MTVKVKLVNRRRSTFLDRLFFPAILKGLSITFMRMFKKKVTMQFPEERWTVRDHYRGMPVLVSDDEGRPKCVACSLCEYVCPPKAIFIVPQELEAGTMVWGANRKDMIFHKEKLYELGGVRVEGVKKWKAK